MQCSQSTCYHEVKVSVLMFVRLWVPGTRLVYRCQVQSSHFQKCEGMLCMLLCEAMLCAKCNELPSSVTHVKVMLPGLIIGWR